MKQKYCNQLNEMEYYSAFKEKHALPFATTQMNLGDITSMLSEISQVQD